MGKDIITIPDFRNYFAGKEHGIPDATIRWRVYHLLQLGIIHRIGYGIYKLGSGLVYIPAIPDSAVRIYNSVIKTFPYANTCIWHTSSLNEFTIHQLAKFHLLVEVEKEAVEPVYYYFKGKREGVFVNPDERIYRDYISGNRETIIVKTLISEAPTQKANGLKVPTLEKILVDIFCESVIFSSVKGKEMQNIYESSFEKYTINFNAFFRYATRRNRKDEIQKYLESINIVTTEH